MTTASMILLALAVVLLGGGVPTSSADELQHNQTYAAGTRVETSSVGVSFVIPEGWVGKFGQDADNQVLILGSNTIEGMGLAILQSGRSAAQIVAGLADAQDFGAGVVLQPTARPEIEGRRITARYQNPTYVGRALALVGPAQNGIVFFFAGPRKHERLYLQVLESLAGATRFLQPRAATAAPPTSAPGEPGREWSNLLTGQMLHYFSTYNSGGGGGGMAAHRVLHLCAGGRFAYFGDSSVTMNVPGASASSGGRDGFRGQWRIESPTASSAVLVLTGDGGRQLRWPVRYDGSKTFLNGQRWLRAQSDVCR